MADASHNPPAVPRRKPRFWQFSLRTMLLAITAFCLWLGIVAHRANKQKEAVARILRLNGWANYDYEGDPRLNGRTAIPPGPGWLREAIGIDYFATVVAVRIAREPSEDDLDQIIALPAVRELFLDFNPVPDKLMIRLRRMRQLNRLIVIYPGVSPDAERGVHDKWPQLEFSEAIRPMENP